MQKIKLNEYYNWAKKWFWTLPIWKRSILSSFFGAISGSIFLSFINRYALYKYAFINEFRIPVEGAEYLDLSVALLSFAVLIISSIGAITIYYGVVLLSKFLNVLIKILSWVFGFISKRFKKKEKEKKETNFKGCIKQVVIFIMLIGFLVFYSLMEIIEFIGVKLFGGEKTVYTFEPITTEDDFIVNAIFLIATISLTIFLAFIVVDWLKSEKLKRNFTYFFVGISILILTSSLFYQPFYSGFLSQIKYGGKVPITLEYRKADNTEDLITGELLLRSSEGIILVTNDSIIHEVPMERISRILMKK